VKILSLGNEYFRSSLIRAGVEVVQAGAESEADLKIDPDQVDLAALIERVSPPPDVLLLTDDLGRRVLPWGLERCRLPRVYYAVDGPINLYWQRHLAGLFDLVVADQKDCALTLSERLDREVIWLPVAVDPGPYQGPEEEEKNDFAFVGTLEPAVRPKRSNILATLQSRFQVALAGERGSGWVGPEKAGRLYRQSRLVLNENLFPGVTTRMMETLAAGGCLFTEDCGNGLTDLFEPGEHLITFGPDDLISQAGLYLADRAARRRIASKGRQEFLARHTIFHRAQTLLAAIESLRSAPPRAVQDLASLAWTSLLLGLRKPEHDGQRRLARSRLLFKEAVRRGPSEVPARWGLGLALAALDRREEAVDELDGAARLANNEFRIHLARGMILTEAGRWEEGSQDLAQAAAMAGGADLADEASNRQGLKGGQAAFHLAWGLILTRAGEGLWPGFNRSRLSMAFWGALEHLARAVDLEPGNLKALVTLAGLLDGHGQEAFSRPLWFRAADLAPGDESIAASLARAEQLSYWSG